MKQKLGDWINVYKDKRTVTLVHWLKGRGVNSYDEEESHAAKLQWTYFTLFSSISIVEFEKVNVSWVCIKQPLSNIWSTIHEKVRQLWGWVEKNSCLQKKRVLTGKILIQYQNLLGWNRGCSYFQYVYTITFINPLS